MTSIYFAELTDTFGGEANYSWVTRFKVHSTSPLGAIQKISRETGLHFRKQWDDGFTVRYDSRSGATCVFLTPYADEAEIFSRVVSL